MQMPQHSFYDIVVIGGGPAGSTLSTLLVRKGYRVLVLEREKFPRFHVGESLLPASQPIWQKLGIADPLQHLSNAIKYGGEIRVGADPNDSHCESSIVKFKTLPTNLLGKRPYSYNVERSEFDLFLLNHSRQEGAKVYEEAIVKEILWEGEKAVGVRWKTKQGEEYITKAGCIADCSGRQAFIARQRKLIVPHPEIKTSAVFGHFAKVTRDDGLRQDYIHTYFFEHGWIWFIPLECDRMSVGVVVNEPESDWWSSQSPEQILLTYINRYKFLRDRFEEAEQTSKVRIMRGLPYTTTQSAGDGWILVGDANFFVDPLFSSGVHVAFHTAEKAADAIAQFLSGDRTLVPFQRYHRWGKYYQFHIFTTIGLFYKMLNYRVSVEGLVKLTSKGSDNRSNPIAQRMRAWIAGYFDRFYWVLYLAWCICSVAILIGIIREKIFGIAGWDTHQQLCSEPPLKIPKSEQLLTKFNQPLVESIK